MFNLEGLETDFSVGWAVVREPEFSGGSYAENDYAVIKYKESDLTLKLTLHRNSYGTTIITQVEPIKGKVVEKIEYFWQEE